MKMRIGRTVRCSFWSWLIISAVWIFLIAVETWRDIPRDDWVIEPPSDDGAVAVATTGIFNSPVARAVVGDGIVVALVPPILAFVCGWIFIRTFRPRDRN